MDSAREKGNCRYCDAAMSVYAKNCPNCGADAVSCFVSKAQQQENLKAVRSQIFRNMRDALKAKFK